MVYGKAHGKSYTTQWHHWVPLEAWPHTCILRAFDAENQGMFVGVAWHVPSDLYRLIVSAAGNIPPKKASDIFPSLGISEARLPKLVGVIASNVGSNASNDRSEFTQAHTRSIASKMLWHIA